MLIHHIMVVTGTLMGIYAVGYSAGGVCNVAAFCEVSAIFLNYRSMWSKEQMNDPAPTVNQLCFFFSYFIFRVIMFPWCWYMLLLPALYTYHLDTIPIHKKIIGSISISIYFVVILLNFYWFGLILKGLKRMMQEKGIIAKKAGEKEDDRLNFGLEDSKEK